MHVYPHITCFAEQCSALMYSWTVLRPRSMLADFCEQWRVCNANNKAYWHADVPEFIAESTREPHTTRNSRDVRRKCKRQETHIVVLRGTPSFSAVFLFVAHALCCHLFDIEEFLCGTVHSRSENIGKTCVVRQTKLWCMELVS